LTKLGISAVNAIRQFSGPNIFEVNPVDILGSGRRRDAVRARSDDVGVGVSSIGSGRGEVPLRVNTVLSDRVGDVVVLA
jgi:hypothetical protein